MSNGDSQIPEGLAFLALSTQQQDACAVESRRALKRLSLQVQDTYAKLGTVLSLADRFASCFWGCHGREHIIEALVGRTASSARAVLRLIEFGHYDEALALVRNLAEIGNLMQLFFVRPEEIRMWLDLPEKERKSRYAPAEVRKALERAGSVVPHDQSKYRELCEVAVHPTPQTKPQAHNMHHIPTLGGFYQEKGQITCLNELAWVLATVVGPAAKIAILDRSNAEAIVKASIELVKSLTELADDYREVTDSSSHLLEKTGWLDRNLRRKSNAS